MDWPLAITRNSEALKRIVAALFVMIGAATAALTSPGLSRRCLGEGARGAVTLPRHVYAAIMLVLRPAESAVRRLIVIAARGLVLKPRALRPFLANLPAFPASDASKTPIFCLFDPLKAFSLNDHDNSALPHFTFHSGDDAVSQPRRNLQQEHPVNATLLFTRLRALRSALNDLPRQARRLIRWQTRRDLALNSKAPFKPVRITPFRPGLPPGWRQRSIHEIDGVLHECHGLAVYALNGLDTS